MTTIFFRTLIVYAILMGALRLMGKRQIGELEVSELVTTLLISEIASLPIENPEFPISFAAIPIITLLVIEIGSSALLIKFPALRTFFSSRPSVLVRDGIPIEKELRKARISLEELLSSLRQKDVSDITEVDYAILEQNGQISVLKKRLFQPPDANTLMLSVKEQGITHILVSDGKINRYNANNLPNGKRLLERALKKSRYRLKDVLLLLADDAGGVRIIPKEGAKRMRKGGTS